LESRTETQVTLDPPHAQATRVSVARICWHGWHDCYLIANGRVEAVVVPAIGRAMQLRLTGEADGAFWESRELDGELHATAPNQADLPEWINFGGDKCWPAPQSDWLVRQGRDWPPPIAFDSSPMDAVAGEDGVVLTSPVDSAFGIQVTRHVELDAELPVMRIRTEFHKVIGDTVRVSVWTITQMNDPERVFVPLREDSKMPGGFILLIEAEPERLRIEDGLLSFVRTRLKLVVRIDAEAGPGEYPDGGCVTQVYTSPDPVPYVELETLGPLATMSAGDRIERTTTYTIMPRSTTDPEAEARKILCS
jgi:hypothetical protein